MRHVVWDWNGTLLDDLTVVVAAVNDTLATLGRQPITNEEYGAHYTRPVRLFYEKLLSRPVADDEWHSIDDEFHRSYGEQVAAAPLADGATEALRAVTGAGMTQSLLSMYWHTELVPAVRRFGIDRHLIRVDGLRGEAGDRKEEHLRAHLQALAADLGRSVPAQEVLVVGDALDDADAARALGAHCVLYDGGAHPAEQLATAGVPVVSSLPAALTAGGVGDS